MKKKQTLLLPILLFTAIITASEEPDDEIITKTPNDASKIVPGSEEKAEKTHLDKGGATCRIGRKRRRQSAASDRKKMAMEPRIVHEKQ